MESVLLRYGGRFPRARLQLIFCASDGGTKNGFSARAVPAGVCRLRSAPLYFGIKWSSIKMLKQRISLYNSAFYNQRYAFTKWLFNQQSLDLAYILRKNTFIPSAASRKRKRLDLVFFPSFYYEGKILWWVGLANGIKDSSMDTYHVAVMLSCRSPPINQVKTLIRKATPHHGGNPQY